MIRVIFFATPQIALKSLDYLVKSDKIDVLAVVTQPDKPTGRGHKILPPPVKQYALVNNIPVFQPVSIKKDFQIQAELKKLEPDFFVTFAFGQILSKDILNIPKYATINLQASLLPLYRGANPIQRAIINGETKTGICTMVTEEGLDCGDICLRDEIEITENMNYEELFELIAQKAPELIEVTLLNIQSGALKTTAQVHEKATYANKINKEDAKIDWNKPARDIHNIVRGLYKSPSAHCFFRGKLVKILETRVVDEEIPEGFLGHTGEILKISKEGIEVATQTGVLLIVKVKPEGKSEMAARDWVNGLKPNTGEKIFMITRGIRGATTVENNSIEALEEATLELLQELISKNNINKDLISHVIFTLTDDLNTAFPAKFARQKLGWDKVAMMCFHELDVPNSLAKCLRVLIVLNCEENFISEFVYLKGAASLRG